MALQERDFWVGQIIYQLQGVVLSDNMNNTEYHLSRALEGFSSLVQMIAQEYGIEPDELVA